MPGKAGKERGIGSASELNRPKLAGWCRSPATLDSTHQSRGNRLLVHRSVDAEVLSLLEFLETGAGALAAEPALLDTSERSGRVGHDSTVDARPCPRRTPHRGASRAATHRRT